MGKSKGGVMELEEAHRLADRYRLATFCLSDSESATVILDDRITELEAEMKQILSEFDEVEARLKIKQPGVAG